MRWTGSCLPQAPCLASQARHMPPGPTPCAGQLGASPRTGTPRAPHAAWDDAGCSEAPGTHSLCWPGTETGVV